MALFFALSALVLWSWRSNNSSSSNRIIIIVAFIPRSTTTAEIVAWLLWSHRLNWTAVWLRPNFRPRPKILQLFLLLSLPRRPASAPNECIRPSQCNSKRLLSPRYNHLVPPPWPEIMAIGSPLPPILPQSPWILSTIVSPTFLHTRHWRGEEHNHILSILHFDLVQKYFNRIYHGSFSYEQNCHWEFNILYHLFIDGQFSWKNLVKLLSLNLTNYDISNLTSFLV